MGYSRYYMIARAFFHVREHKIDIIIRILSLPYRNNHVLARGILSSASHLRDKSSSMQNRRVLPHDVIRLEGQRATFAICVLRPTPGKL